MTHNGTESAAGRSNEACYEEPFHGCRKVRGYASTKYMNESTSDYRYVYIDVSKSNFALQTQPHRRIEVQEA